MLKDFHPTADNLLCQQLMEADHQGKIIIPDSVKKPLHQAVVLEAGENCDKELYVPGRIIIFSLHTESRVSIDGKNYIIVDPGNVLLTGPIVPEEIE